MRRPLIALVLVALSVGCAQISLRLGGDDRTALSAAALVGGGATRPQQPLTAAATPSPSPHTTAPARRPARARRHVAAPRVVAGLTVCHLTRRHPVPVVLVHGLGATATSNWGWLQPRLAHLGFCVYALDYGNRGVAPMQLSARDLGHFVARVRSATHARKVSIVGQSEGGLMPRWWLRFDKGARVVDQFIGLAPVNHGTVNQEMAVEASHGCAACGEMVAGSSYLRVLNAGHEVVKGVGYTTIVTRYDRSVRPYTSGYLAGAHVRNIAVQDVCPSDTASHVSLGSDPVVLRLVVAALQHTVARPGC